MSKPNDIAEYVNQLSVDLKAETLFALLKKDLAKTEDILVAFDGQLKRTYGKDVSEATVREFENGEKVLEFHLNRDGIYDSLPEALFHSFSEEALIRGEEMARDSMKLKSEEKETRSFFQPYENLTFNQLVNLATKENSLFENVYSRVLHALIPNFWNIHNGIPSEYTERLIRLIPMTHQIVGNKELTVEAFEFILKEIVSIDFRTSHDFKYKNLSKESAGGGLGDCQLGIDLYSGDQPEIPIGIVEVSIGPICRLDVTHYLGGGWLKILLDSIYSYFLPMDVQVSTNIMPGIDNNEFSLNEVNAEDNTFLGFNTVL